ncbi:MAG TPA: tetratricopeptide repeat protein [Bryobacteraceae bacterium]
MKEITQGQIDDAKRSLSEALTGDISRLEPVCAGLLSNNVADGLQKSGRLDEVRTLAEQAINYYQQSLPADDPIYLGPLEKLATADLEQGMTGRARDAMRRMQMIHTTDPQGRVLLLYVNGCLLKREGRSREAESQLTGALSALADAGKQNSADGATIRGELANLYVQEHSSRQTVQSNVLCGLQISTPRISTVALSASVLLASGLRTVLGSTHFAQNQKHSPIPVIWRTADGCQCRADRPCQPRKSVPSSHSR